MSLIALSRFIIMIYAFGIIFGCLRWSALFAVEKNKTPLEGVIAILFWPLMLLTRKGRQQIKAALTEE